MTSFAYVRAASLQEVCALLAQQNGEAALLAGGTDLLVRIRAGRQRPRMLIDLKHVAGLPAEVRAAGDGLTIGPLATLTTVGTHPLVAGRYPALAEAALSIGSVQIRNRGTLAGNLCNASPAADTAPALLVYGARVHLFSLAGRRSIPLAQFFTGPGKTVLQPGELVEEIALPPPPAESDAAFMRIARRRGMDLASVNVAAQVAGSGEVRVAYGAVAPTPILVVSSLEAGLEQLAAAAQPITDVRAGREYRQAMLMLLLQRALEKARERLARKGAEKR